MNTSPCAKLMSLRMPYTIVYPMAMRAYRLPRERALVKCCKNNENVICLPNLRYGIGRKNPVTDSFSR